MKKPILITSIPPGIKRVDAKGNTLGLEYIQFCVDSWIDAGFSPVSVNSRREYSEVPSHIKGVEFIIVDRDASAFVGKPLVYIQDMLRIGANRCHGVFAVTNADIFLNFSADIFERILSLHPGQFVAENRIDTRSTIGFSGSKFCLGYDFFAFNSSDVRDYSDDGFVFGVPWWDHYLPLTMIFAGLNKVDIGIPFAYHLLHDERWDIDLWRLYGNVFVSCVTKYLEQLARGGNLTFEEYNEIFIKAGKFEINELNFFVGYAKRFCMIKNYLQDKKLSRVARLNVQLIGNKRVC